MPGEPCGSTLHRCNLDGAVCSRFTPCRGADRVCRTCTLHPVPGGTRHLAYHLLPVKGSRWLDNVKELKARWYLFNGIKVVSVVTGDPVVGQGGGPPLELEDPDVVRAALPPDAEVFLTRNDPRLWELASWPGLWGAVLGRSAPGDTVFYAHAKGVTRPAMTTPLRWARIMYSALLDDPGAVREALSWAPLAGCLKRTIASFQTHHPELKKSRWHYSGNFWWADCDILRARLESRPPPEDPWAAEAWVGMAYAPAEGADLLPLPKQTSSLYRDRDCIEVEKALRRLRLTPAPPARPVPIQTQ